MDITREITQRRLRELLVYDQITGVFTWRSTWYGHKAGIVAGCKGGSGYWRICLDGASYQAHRLAWMYVNGSFPPAEIDHKNRNRRDNRLSNLRPASPSQNRMNTSRMSNNTSGFKGVHFHRRSGKWQAQVQREGKRWFLGLFESAEAASAARTKAAIKLHAEFAL